jgi:chemotaxis protein CheY-P-specific phosphatase CheC
MNILSKKEKALARQIIDAGYQNAAKSFSLVTRQNIEIEIAEIEVTQSEPHYQSLLKSGEDITMLTTKIIGEVSGKSFLLLNEEERQAIYRACLGPQKDEAQRKVMEEAILKEIDNIISATVITQFSNALGFSIYGGVPELTHLKAEQIDTLIAQDLSQASDCLFTINTRFRFENNTALQPHFFWILSSQFLERIKQQAA